MTPADLDALDAMLAKWEPGSGPYDAALRNAAPLLLASARREAALAEVMNDVLRHADGFNIGATSRRVDRIPGDFESECVQNWMAVLDKARAALGGVA